MVKTNEGSKKRKCKMKECDKSQQPNNKLEKNYNKIFNIMQKI